MSKRRPRQSGAAAQPAPPSAASSSAPPAPAPRRPPGRRAPTRRGPSALTLSLLIGLGVVAVAAFLLTRPPAPSAEQPRDNIKGSASAAVVVEEWEDFQ